MFFNSDIKLCDWEFYHNGIVVFLVESSGSTKPNTASKKSEIFYRFQCLLESSQASVDPKHGGIYLLAEDAVCLDDETRELFELPPKWPGSLILEKHSLPNLRDFTAKLRLIDPDGYRLDSWTIQGGILKVGKDNYLPSAETYNCLQAYTDWKDRVQSTEIDHWTMIHALAEAARQGCRVDFSSIGNVKVRQAKEVVIDAREQNDGSILLTPVPIIAGLAELLGMPLTPGNEVEVIRRYVKEVENRLSQLGTDSSQAIFRIGQTIIPLTLHQSAQARGVAKNRTIPKEIAADFKKNPGLWLANRNFAHGEVDFLPRVIGIGEWSGSYLGSSGELGEKTIWEVRTFSKNEERERSGNSETGGASDKPTQEQQPPEQQVTIIHDNISSISWGRAKRGDAPSNAIKISPDYSKYPRSPYPHQREAIEWLGECARHCGQPQRWNDSHQYWGSGALLADDMGLGKTLTALIFLREWLHGWEAEKGQKAPACLIVCPLSLVENWQKEITKSYAPELNPFSRVVKATASGDLAKFYVNGGKDCVIPGTKDGGGEVESYGLKFCNADEQMNFSHDDEGYDFCINKPGTIVITTYTTLRDYRFSFAACDWSAVIFDEAQNIKNPNALQTIAAKSLKGFFRIALSGTPVENHLGDLWCLMDTAEPGALGSFEEFKKRWINPISKDNSKLQEVGRNLRDYLDDWKLVLRRTKEQTLEGLPKKIQAPPDRPLLIEMTPQQAERYDEIIDCANSVNNEMDSTKKTNYWLTCIWELRRVSLHPQLIGDAVPRQASTETESRNYMRQSGKLAWLLDELDKIRNKGEKVLVFAIQKKFQELLRDHLSTIYEIKIPVINGDTKAIENEGSNPTRMKLIEQFSERSGFGICVLSPIAAGAGLNITAANHVFHLERHWNPAKEDQATDRAYRIGQEREVYVHAPLLRHPSRNISTFDQSLHKLITQKKNLAGSLGFLPTPSVSMGEMFKEVFGNTENSAPQKTSSKLTPKEAHSLSWEHFEALIACIYEPEADRVILTPRGRDHGVDVVVIGHRTNTNILIQVKTTTTGALDSEEAIRQLEGGRRYYENALGLKFSKMRVHTNVNKFSNRTIKAAKVYKTETLGFDWLESVLKKKPITMGDIISRNAQRDPI